MNFAEYARALIWMMNYAPDSWNGFVRVILNDEEPWYWGA